MERGTEIMAAARELARIGPVMPVRGKVPLWTDWPARATRAPNGEPEWQEATGIGLLTGERAGYFVLDVDGPRGKATLDALELERGSLPTTWLSRTGGGGLHFFFRWPGFLVRGSASKLGPGLDVRGEGGQVVAPPSLHASGSRYAWQLPPWGFAAPHDSVPPEAPSWLLEMLKPPAPRLVHSAPSGSDILRRAAAYLARIPGAVSKQRGHDQTWNAALKVVRGFALSEDDGFALLWAEYNPRCEPPWNEKQLRHKVSDVTHDSTVPWGFLRDAPYVADPPPPRSAPPPGPREEPGCDDGDPTPAIKPPRFVMEKLSDLLAEVIPPTKWLLAPYVPACSFGELVGPPGKGKTTFMAWMLMQMASAGYRCAVIEEEGSRRGLQRLLSRAMEAIGSNVSERIGFMHSQHVNLLNALDVQALSEVLRGFDFVLFDSFSLVTPGLDEDKAKDGGPVIKDLLWLRDTLKIAPWFNHHSGKSKWKSGEVPHLGDGRGSSIWPGALDTELSMRPVENAEEGFIQFDLFVTKMREGDDQVKPQRVSIARNGPAAIVQMHNTDADVAPPVDGHLLLEVLNFVAAAGLSGTSKNQIEKNVVGKTDSIRDALMALKYSGRVEEIPAGQYTKWRVL